MCIYTRQGDSGKTTIVGGEAISKDSPILDACGTLDELSSFIGVLRGTLNTMPAEKDFLHTIQQNLLVVGSHLACGSNSNIIKSLPRLQCDVTRNIELRIAEKEKNLTSISNFIIPGGNLASSYAHVCRTICRRAERNIVRAGSYLNDDLVYINRLSDYFFCLARSISEL